MSGGERDEFIRTREFIQTKGKMLYLEGKNTIVLPELRRVSLVYVYVNWFLRKSLTTGTRWRIFTFRSPNLFILC